MWVDIFLPITTRHYGRPPSFESTPDLPLRRVHMPLTSFESYVSTSEEYISHWDQVNSALGSPMTLPGGYTRANLISDRAAIDAAITTCAASLNAKQISAGNKVT